MNDQSSLFGEATRPLADRIRPRLLDDVIGQTGVVGEGQFIRALIASARPTSLILWGPPGTGKTTLARIIAASGEHAFEEISAVTSGLPDVKKVIERARERQRMGQSTVLFVDEIHRFNKAQQDAFLPHMENGTITLIGATTENPSFEVIGPLLSRSRVVVLEKLTVGQLEAIIDRGLADLHRQIEPAARKLLAELAAGDARSALGGLEAASSICEGTIRRNHITLAMQRTTLAYDKNGEYHYNIISAFIKSLRGGAIDAALIYLARMIEAGEDPKFIARRMLIFASEDIGLADSSMLTLAVSTFQAVERVGVPESRLILGHAAIALAQAPKSRAADEAITAAQAAVREHPDMDVPLHLRNAPTRLMKDLDYGHGYEWQAGFEHPDGFMPEALKGRKFYQSEAQKKKPS